VRNWCIILCLLATPAVANNQEKLADTLKELEVTSQKAKELSEQISRVNSELGALENKRTTLLTDMKQLDKRMQTQRGNITALEQKIAIQEAELESQRDAVGSLLYGMIRMQRLPRHYVLGKPDDTETLLKTASALNVTYGASEAEFAQILAAHKALLANQTKLREEESVLKTQQANFRSKERELKDTLAARQSFHASLGSKQAEANQKVERLSDRAGSLKELLDGLAEEKEFFATLEPQFKPKASAPKTSFASRKGALALPEGETKYRFAQKVGSETQRGMTLVTPAQSLVQALHPGTIVFAGDFMDYGNMVIVQHDDGWHSVTAGMDVLYVEPGEVVRQDATLGVMGETPDARELYVELRKGSKPVDPAPWMRKVRELAASR